MNFEKWHDIHSLLSSEGFQFHDHTLSINENIIADFNYFRLLVVRARDAFIEECRLNWVKEENKQLVLQTYFDLREKLKYVIMEFFIIENRDGHEIISYRPLGIELDQRSADLSVTIPGYIFYTIQILQEHLISLISRHDKNIEPSKEKTTRKYDSAYLSHGYQLSPRLKAAENYMVKLQRCYCDLKNYGFIGDGYQKEFLTLFEGSLPSRPIEWSGNLSSLKYFINQLHEMQLIVNPKRRLFAIAESAFMTRDGRTIQHMSLSARKDPVNPSTIDQIIAEILS